MQKIKPVELFWLFLKIGSFAFGGFMALIAVVEKIIVKEKELLTQEDVLDGISLGSLMPGPMAVNVITYIGYRIGGFWGALATATGVIIPSFILMMVFSWIYSTYGNIDFVKAFFQGVIPAVAAVICEVVWRMGKKNLKSALQIGLAIIGLLILAIAPKQYQVYSTLLVMLISGFAGYLFLSEEKKKTASLAPFPLVKFGMTILPILILAVLTFLALPIAANSLGNLFITFGGMSVMLFGGGYVFIPLLQEVVTSQYQWVGEQAFIDSIALGQVTPGPICISVAFIGFQVKGFWGALVSTIGIFGPPALLMIAASTVMEYMKQSAVVTSIMKGIRSGVIGMIFYSAYIVLISAFPEGADPLSYSVFVIIGIFILSLFALFRFKFSVLVLLPLAGILGILFLR